MAGYINEAFLTTYGITDPSAYTLIEPASRIIDLHLRWPYNNDGFKFPRVANDALGVPSDAGVVPIRVKYATAEQIIFMLQVGQEYLVEGGDEASSESAFGAARTHEVNSPLLAPLARLYLGGLAHRVGYMQQMATVLVIDHFPEFEGDITRAVEHGVMQATLETERRAVPLAPFKTGNLRNSIASMSSGTQGSVYASASYGIYQEEGTRFFAGKHFLERALDSVAPEIDNFIRGAL